jgi:hypothetical protein
MAVGRYAAIRACLTECWLLLCNRFCGIVLVWAEVSSCFLAAHMTDLAPLWRGFFCEFSLALCNHLSYCIGGVCRCSHRQTP